MYNLLFCKYLKAAMLIAGFCGMLPLAMADKILWLEDAVEADSIVVELEKDAQNGLVRVAGCNVCPLDLRIDAKTEFYSKGKLIKREQIAIHSGKTGTVRYIGDEKRSTAIIW